MGSDEATKRRGEARRSGGPHRPVLHGLPVLVAALVCTPALAQMPSAVRVEPVRRETVTEHRQVTGQLHAVRRSQVAAQEPGRVIAVPVREGQVVAAGDVLARLDRRRLDLRLQEIEADAAVAAAMLTEREQDQAWKQRDLDLVTGSFEDGAANPRELQDARSAHAMAVARASAAEQSVKLIEARADLVRERIQDTTITAPFGGIVVARHVELGEWLAEGDPVIELVSGGPVEAWLRVPQRFIEPLQRPDVAVAVRLDATGTTTEAEDLRIVPQVDTRARSFTLIATIPNEKRLLAPGMSVTAWVPTGVATEHLTVANDAVLRNETGAYVYVVRDGDAGPQVFPMQIEVLFPLVGRSVIRAGRLREGTRVVVEGNERLFPSMSVTIAGTARSRPGPGGTGGDVAIDRGGGT